MTKDTKCLVAPPILHIEKSANKELLSNKKAHRWSSDNLDKVDDLVSRAFAIQEPAAPVEKANKNQDITVRNTLHNLLAGYMDYGAGWDGEGANAIEVACLNNVRLLIDNLPINLLEKIGSYDLFPTPNGTITIEIGDNNQYFVIDVGNTKILYYYRFNNLIAGLNESISFAEGIFQKIAELFSEFDEKSQTGK